MNRSMNRSSSKRRESGRRRNSNGRRGSNPATMRFSTRLQFADTISQFLNAEDVPKDSAIDDEEFKGRIEEDDDEDVESISSSEGNSGEREMSPQKKRQSRALTASMVKATKSGNRAVKWSKILVFSMLLVVATIILVWTHFFLKNEATEDFEFGFQNLSLEMLFRVNVKMSKMESAFRTISILITSYTTSKRASLWPLVTIPNWQIRAMSTQEMSKAIVLGISPLVPTANISHWEEYSLNKYHEWMDDTLNHQEKLLEGLNPDNGGHQQQPMQVWQEDVSRDIYIPELVYEISQGGYRVPVGSSENSNGFVLPMWELAPAPRYNATIVNYNLMNHSVLSHAVQQLLHTRQPVLTPAFPDIEWWWEGAASPSIESDLGSQVFHQPCSLFLQPIFDEIPGENDDSLILGSSQEQEQLEAIPPPKIVGIAHAVIPWNVYMEQNLADKSVRGVHVVMDWIPATDGCYESKIISSPPPTDADIHSIFTYRIDGKRARFIDYGDLHESRYEDMMESMDFHVPTTREQHQQGDCTHGHYQFRVYPTLELKETNFNPSNVKPWLYALGVVAIFCVAGAIFLSYDYLVQLRQQAVLDTAIRSNAIISSLFPSNVRDRIMKDAEEQAKQEARQRKLERNLRKKEKRKRKKAAVTSNQSINESESVVTFPKHQLKDFLNEGTSIAAVSNDDLGYGDAKPSQTIPEPPAAFGSKPIADLFPNATVLFADIIGFNAWSSVRQPQQVFQLLETVYHHFDECAQRRHVFKVETIGDCYVAVTGLPEPRRDHALVMCRFAKDIMAKMNEICPRLEVILGPDTGDLQLRIGVHSGPVTAGVLRGEKSRFQLFGDTVNTAARMESTGAPSKMHISKETADLLKAAGKKWAKKREDKVHAKGKGEMETFWLAPGKTVRHGAPSSNASSTEEEGEQDVGVLKPLQNLSARNGMSSNSLMNGDSNRSLLRSSHLQRSLHHVKKKRSLHGPSEKAKENGKKNERLVQWNGEVLLRLLQQIQARRTALKQTHDETDEDLDSGDGNALYHADSLGLSQESEGSDDNDEFGGSSFKTTVLEEVKEIIDLPTFDARLPNTQQDATEVELGKEVREQCLEFVREIAAMYRYNPFHNFEHASHVTMSVVKLLSRIVAPESVLENNLKNKGDREHDQLVKSLHDNTYGITSDPLTQFAVVFSALIHDLDHPGVPNATLVKEGTSLANLYKNKSVAEQNSVDVTWEILMETRFKDLRLAIYSNMAEKKRFRQLVVNAVMATDIVDADLKELRNARWDKAFQETSLDNIEDSEELRDSVNRKATIVLEHLLQASDIAHTMQHWHIYRKWNERFFEECYQAYVEGRVEKDPSESWYEGEIGFFNFYIIPLAKKLKDCKVFGVSSDEYLNYAETNKKTWESTGRDVVQSYIEKYVKGASDKETEDEAGFG